MGKVSYNLEAMDFVVYSIRPDNTVLEGIQMLVNRNVGALTVVDHNGNFLGICFFVRL